jgi:hypothetical protein
MANITDPTLNVAKQMVLGDMNKLKNFKACPIYFKTVHQNNLNTRTALTARNASSVQTNNLNRRDSNKRDNVHHDRNNNNIKRQNTGRRNTSSGRKEDKPRVRLGRYTDDEYNQLTSKEKEELKNL